MDSEIRDYRFELLRFAKDMLWEDYNNRRQKSDVEFDMVRDAFRENRVKEMPKFEIPATPTPEEIIKIAETFNKFILAKTK